MNEVCRWQDAEAVFQNNEEVRVIPIYRDPVHDFGFFKFDPSVGILMSSIPICTGHIQLTCD